MTDSFVRLRARRSVADPRMARARLVLLVCCGGIPILSVHAIGQSVGATVQTDRPQVSRDASEQLGSSYVGTSRCLRCHSTIVRSQESAAMGLAALKASDSDFFSANAGLQFHDGAYTLQIQRDQDKVVYTASNGHETLSVPLIWAFGVGHAGQTYIFKNDGVYYESRVSYYKDIHGLDLTIGHSRQQPTTLAAALGRPLSTEELNKCFSCHTSEDMVQGNLVMSNVHPGITCENCHGPGKDHVLAMASSRGESNAGTRIFNPGRNRPADVNEFCGKCHRSTREALASSIRDVRNVRFQPYRLENSRCYDPTDERITCVACHDPHQQLVTGPAKYDAQCEACHAVRGRARKASQRAKACPTASANCVSCHMPKTAIPGSHYVFTDHYIRVSHAGERYPE